ncbi:magnesium/cobalt transporter CorA [Zhouia sp. PK063]|uniref:magnesium/cobalt transporter CorA n=1 Tax=Zhouia sp. PK063 TaxID=3373602 RepID=UPI0037AE9E74
MAKRKTRHKKTSKARKKIGLAPGTVTYIGDKDAGKFDIEIISYNEDIFERSPITNAAALQTCVHTDRVNWINVNGLSNVEEIKAVGKTFNLHPLLIEDIVNTNQRPKLDEFSDYVFVAFKMLYTDPHNEDRIIIEHISLVLGENYVITFQESDGDVFDSLRERIETKSGNIRTRKSDYLLFALLDSMVDHYFEVLEVMGDQVEHIEEQLFEEPDDSITQNIQALKKEALRIRRAAFPIREVMNRLEKTSHPYFQEQTRAFIDDLYDHSIQVIETIEMYREMIWGLMDTYMSSVSNKMNNVMKVLTIIATIFIPLTFIAGIYGMNFDNMPELHYKYSYYITWAVMIIVFVAMMIYFKRKKWL